MRTPMMWPEPVERIASFLRDAQAVGRIEELAPGVDTPPGPAAAISAFACGGRTVVVLAPAERELDRARLARRAGCVELRPLAPPPFPFRGALVLVDRALLAARAVWLEAGSPRHVLALAPTQLLRLTGAETGRFAVDDQGGG
jgi:prolyl-tRNA editing enzyme YbaK/EbsC (Cys-tRNA(Pro) deacylase)